MLRGPVQHLCRLEHSFFPQLIRQLFQSWEISRTDEDRSRSLRVEPGRHHPSERENIVKLRAMQFRRLSRCNWKNTKSEYEIKNQAKPFEAMAHAMQTQINQFVRRSQKPYGNALKRGVICSSPRSTQVEVEGKWVFHVVMQLHVDPTAAPRAMVVIGAAVGAKAKISQHTFCSRKVRIAHEEIEVIAGAQRSISKETLRQTGTLERNDRQSRAIKGREQALQDFDPDKRGELSLPLNLLQPLPPIWRVLAFLKKQTIDNPGKYILFVCEVKQLCQCRVIESVLLGVTAKHLQQRPHSKSHAGAHSPAAVMNRWPITKAALRFDILKHNPGGPLSRMCIEYFKADYDPTN